ncbi:MULTISPECIES: AMIN domain-containing protein [unclassified Corallococcus]|uniref:AMIN domain-containing protein n=1 Tax=unclassified Corallococcus TaxID=2685029 RepID=UPI001A8FE305|nr:MULTISPECIES: AMIN domain-containing protein [unclassified Corallococcus]MBN9684059.1 AMIN domain-containing protein [Corallococcus sp. NCSPR001]WAS84447.1 AMIN domain-containing protein [Corallococcus sp. NCRR]
MKGLAVSLLGLWLVPLVALAQQPVDYNTITAVTVSGGTVEISGSKKADFNSFTMTDPPRLVIDVSGAVFKDVPEELPVGNGTVTGIRTQAYGTESSSIARILIGYEREVETDIQTSGNKLVVKVLGGGPAVAQVTPTEGQGTPAQGTAAATPQAQAQAGSNAQDAARAAASDREAQTQAVKAAADAARAEREAQEKAAAEAAARAKADADAEKKRQEEAQAAAKRQDEERRASEQAAAEERKRQESEAQAAAKRAEDERRATAQAAADQKRQQEEDAKAAARASAEEKRAAAQAAADERQAAAKTAAEQKRAAAEAAAEARRQKEEERQAAAQARREEQQSARESAAEQKRQRAAEARERREQALAARESRARPSQGSAAAASRESGGGAVSSRRKTMTQIGFQQQPDSSRVFVRTNEPVRYTVNGSGNQVVLELENTRVVESNNTLPLDTHFFPSAVSRVEAFSNAGQTVRVVIQLKQGVRYETRQEGGLITLDFPRPGR